MTVLSGQVMQFPVTLELRPSRRLTALLIFMHGMIAAAFALAALPWFIVAVACCLLAVSLWYELRQEKTKAAIRLILKEAAGISVEKYLPVAGGKDIPSHGNAVPTGCVDFGWAVWLRWSPCDEQTGSFHQPRAIMLMPDHVSAEQWRALRIWLRYHCNER